MEIPLNIMIEKAIIIVQKVNVENIVGFAEIQFIDSQGNTIFKHRGFTIKLKQFSESSPAKLSVDFPAFPSKRSKSGFLTSFIIENKTIWRQITESIIKAYTEISGETQVANEDINPDDVPF